MSALQDRPQDRLRPVEGEEASVAEQAQEFPAISGEGAIDPYDLWERSSPPGGGAFPADEEGLVTGRPQYWVTGWDTCERVLRDPGTFSSGINYETMGPVMGKLILSMDGDEHRRYRDLVARAFRASSLERWEGELLRPTVDALLDRIVPRGSADLVADFTHAYPVQIIAGILGVPVADYEQFQRWAEDINFGPADYERSKAASKAMKDYLAPIVEERRARPRGDLVSDLVNAEIDGARLDDDHLYGFLRLLLPAGAETTYRALGSALLALLTHPSDLERVRSDRSLLPAVIEETLRWETSVTMVSREAARGAQLDGVGLPPGASVIVALGSANHDASRYDAPREWRLDREPKPHLAFGTGRHQCLGMHLARLEMRVALDSVLDRLRGLRLDPDAPEPSVTGFAFRSPARLPVVFEAAS
jgi:cytochrome P450